jgi:hypothetical protein
MKKVVVMKTFCVINFTLRGLNNIVFNKKIYGKIKQLY